jgi:hypothetical protein
MINDFVPLGRKKPKVIEPLPKSERPHLPSLEGLDLKEPDFKTPEEISREEDSTAVQHDDGTVAGHFPGPKKRRDWRKVIWPDGKWQRVGVSAAAILIMFGLGAGWTHFFHHTQPVQAAVTKPTVKKPLPPPKPITVPSTLTGLPVDPSVNNRPVTAVMIENSPDARPQSGLDQAGVVFEAIAEGGITRFLALFQDTQPNYIGPVRSSRPYYLQWELGFDAGYAHVGGSPEALQDIKNWHVRDLDQFYNSGAYERISSRYAPHNVYTSIAQLNQVETAKGYTSSKFTGFVRKPDAPSKTPDATSIDMTFSGYYYNTHYAYDATTNTYKRSEGGAAHMELKKDGSQVQIAPKVLVALVMPYSLESDGYHSDYQTIGSGPMTVFEDGTAVKGTWSKSAATSQFVFTDSNGQPLKLNAGQTWISALAATNDISYK